MKDILLLLAGIFSIASALGVVLTRNAVYSAFSLILCFFGLASVYVVLNATFLAMVQILIYTGAIVVLFVFVVMLLNLEPKKQLEMKSSKFFAFLTILGALPLTLIILKSFSSVSTVVAQDTSQVSLRSLSLALFQQYLWPFEILSFFLLALIVSVWAIARPLLPEEEKKDSYS